MRLGIRRISKQIIAASSISFGASAALSEGIQDEAPVSMQTAAEPGSNRIVATSPKVPPLERVALTNVSPLDGRYARSTAPLCRYFSEFSYMKYRTHVEVEYFIALCGILPQLASCPLTPEKAAALRKIYTEFSIEDGQNIKSIERITNHDVKAVEYFVKDQMEELGLAEYKEFVHFGLTSQDVNNTAMPLAIKAFITEVYRPELEGKLLPKLRQMAYDYKDVTMLAKTHGQAATPTRVGKELMVFVERIEAQLKQLDAVPFTGKFGGATGGLNAHVVAYPDVDWVAFANSFYTTQIGLERQQFTTQIEHYDNMAAQFDAVRRINVILLDLCKDMWQYISMDYFKQQVKKNEVGSSAMPHKVNPIDFENAEGNFGLANALFSHLSAKLPVSRLQRDLTDSTVSRNFGVPFGHTIVGFSSLLRGLGKLSLHEAQIQSDLDGKWEVTAEAIQTVLRREQYPNPYEELKQATRGQAIDQAAIERLVANLKVSPAVKEELRSISPKNFNGTFDPARYDASKSLK